MEKNEEAQEIKNKIQELINSARAALAEAESISRKNKIFALYKTEYKDGIMITFDTEYFLSDENEELEWMPSSC